MAYVDKRDPDFWLDPAAEQAAPAAERTTFEQSHAMIDPYVAAGKLHHKKNGRMVELSDGSASKEIRRFEPKRMDGPPGNAESQPIPLNGMKRILFEADSNGDFNCDNVFIAGARFTDD